MSGPDLQFFVLTPGHAQALANLEADIFSDPWSQASFTKLLGLNRFLAVGGANTNGLQAYVTAYRCDTELEIINVGVHSSLRRHGLGKKILFFFLRQACMSDITRITLEVRPGNQAARALYKGCGFTHAGTRPRYYTDTGEDALILEWTPYWIARS